MKILRYITMFMMCIGIGILVGFLVTEHEEELRESYANVKGYFEKEEEEITKVEDEKRDFGLDVRLETYEINEYVIYVDEDFRDINNLIQYEMYPYFKKIEQAIDTEKRLGKEGVDTVKLVMENTEGKGKIWMEYSPERIDSIYDTLGKKFFNEHIKDKGTDVINNADRMYISGSVKKSLDSIVKESILWSKSVEEGEE